MSDRTDIQFENGAIKMAGNLYLPSTASTWSNPS